MVNLYMKFEILQTNDGSTTLFDPVLNETFHSTHGAIQEAMHVFIANGLNYFSRDSALSILEVGFGTGLNALLTYLNAGVSRKRLSYTTVETNPLEIEVINQMNFNAHVNIPHAQILFNQLHSVSWNEGHALNDQFLFKKIHGRIQNTVLETNSFDLIYYDAFGPRAQSEMWEKDLFHKLYDWLNWGGIMVTYCAKGQVKRDLRSIGFNVETLQGPPGKREMIRAIKLDSI